jgi:hypothetical protein
MPMTTDDILARLKGVHRSGDGWMARCPAHDDQNPSLSISCGQDGRILRAGRPYPAQMFRWL